LKFIIVNIFDCENQFLMMVMSVCVRRSIRAE